MDVQPKSVPGSECPTRPTLPEVSTTTLATALFGGRNRLAPAPSLQDILSRLRPPAASDPIEPAQVHQVGVDDVAIGTPPLRPSARSHRNPTLSRSKACASEWLTLPLTEKDTEDLHVHTPSLRERWGHLWHRILDRCKQGFPRARRMKQEHCYDPYFSEWETEGLSQEEGWMEAERSSGSPTQEKARLMPPSVGCKVTELPPFPFPDPVLDLASLTRYPGVGFPQDKGVSVPVVPKMSPRPTRSGGAPRPLDCPSTFTIDAAHNGFTQPEAYALFLEKRALQGYRLRARVAPPRPKGDCTPAHWNEQWNQAWAAMESFQAQLAEVRTPEQWHDYVKKAPRQSVMYQRWVPMAFGSDEDRDTMPWPESVAEQPCAGGTSWAMLARLVACDQQVQIAPGQLAMPRRWTTQKADALLARWMRRVGLQVIQWPWTAGESPELKWKVFQELRRCQRSLVTLTGWSGPVLGFGGPLWWAMGAEVGVSSGGMATSRYGVPYIQTGGTDWFEPFFHEWFHTLEFMLANSAPQGGSVAGYQSRGLIRENKLISDDAKKPEDQRQRSKYALRRSYWAVHALLEGLRDRAKSPSPEDWDRVRAHYQGKGVSPWRSSVDDRRQAAIDLFFKNHYAQASAPRAERRVRNEPTTRARSLWNRADELSFIYRLRMVQNKDVPHWFDRMAGHVEAQKKASHHRFIEGKRVPKEVDWWSEPAEHLAMAFEMSIACLVARTYEVSLSGLNCLALTLTPGECAHMRPAWEQFFRTLDPVWRRMVRLRYTAWHHHPFPLAEGSARALSVEGDGAQWASPLL